MSHDYDIDQKLQEWRINGFTVFDGLIPHDKLDHILEAWAPIRDADIERQGELPPRGRFRYNVQVPFASPFVDAEIFDHDAVVEFLSRVLGNDYVWTHYDSNIPLPGTDYQGWHRDGASTVQRGVMLNAFTIGVKFPLLDTNLENGSFEVLPGTQYLADEDLDSSNLENVLGSGEQMRGTYYPLRLNLKKGSLWMQDGRAIHRGTPNRSDRPRDELCMAFSAPLGVQPPPPRQHRAPPSPRPVGEPVRPRPARFTAAARARLSPQLSPNRRVTS